MFNVIKKTIDITEIETMWSPDEHIVNALELAKDVGEGIYDLNNQIRFLTYYLSRSQNQLSLLIEMKEHVDEAHELYKFMKSDNPAVLAAFENLRMVAKLAKPL